MKIRSAGEIIATGAFGRRGWNVPADVTQSVSHILESVRERGDRAVLEYTKRFDDADLDATGLRIAVPPAAIAARSIPPDVASALQLAVQRVEDFHRRQLPAGIAYATQDGCAYEYSYRPLRAIAAYVPAGTSPLPSSVIMNVVPAKIAGVRRVIVLTPPLCDGSIHPAIAYACALTGVDEVYAIGGAQAIAAAAYGTQSVSAVDKIVGPGNQYVTEAKRQIFGVCGIDGLAGPSEVLVIADGSADPRFVVYEILAQAEHDRKARVAVLSESRRFLERCGRELARISSAGFSRSAIVEAVLSTSAFFVHAASFDELVGAAQEFAPEHLSLQVADPGRYAAIAACSGAVFVGPSTPVACGDYVAGTNHVLPTSGTARFASGLRTLDFMRSYATVRYSEARMRDDAPALAALATYEGLDLHAASARRHIEYA